MYYAEDFVSVADYLDCDCDYFLWAISSSPNPPHLLNQAGGRALDQDPPQKPLDY